MGLDQNLYASDQLLDIYGMYHLPDYDIKATPYLEDIQYYRKNYHLQYLVLKIHPVLSMCSNQAYLPLTKDDVEYLYEMGGIDQDVFLRTIKSINDGKYVYYYNDY